MHLKQHFQLYLNFLFAKDTTWSLAKLRFEIFILMCFHL
jgi:hypothetical protein